MAPVTDLTWQAINTALGGTAAYDGSSGPSSVGQVVLVLPADAYNPHARVMVDVSAVTGLSIATLSQPGGVIAFMVKLREACVVAQNQANQNAAVGDKLASFPTATYGTVANNAVTVTEQIVSRIGIVPLSNNQIVGVNA